MIHLQSTVQLYTSNSKYVSYSNIEQVLTEVLLNTQRDRLQRRRGLIGSAPLSVNHSALHSPVTAVIRLHPHTALLCTTQDTSALFTASNPLFNEEGAMTGCHWGYGEDNGKLIAVI